MFTEAQIRFLKAKLRVMQEELDSVVCECRKKVRAKFSYLQSRVGYPLTNNHNRILAPLLSSSKNYGSIFFKLPKNL